ncbi:squalene--hopene cyclase [Streptomyces spectabilis]|uniref:Squalene-hopene/tetraprenyl-beta-curcumene cyclase n=1 Tax=Streptomyces spectabilis TaxID=68270 RepID=A0A7W8B3P0_STRST|nr:squalene--hopene cyclase [Streptomyces spectabilis]MBB5109789.1 squalene-hopene/tetraprenyl-beta-curcumene cyclase [Streptomyces spectabilis]GGV55589.1 squalene-hopene cyclase [Streptomyces spectabilis]
MTEQTHTTPPRSATFARSALRQAAADSAKRATAHLQELQHDDGRWQGDMGSNVTTEAEELMLHAFLGTLWHDAAQRQRAEQSAAWIRYQQEPDGGWAQYPGGPTEVSTSIEAYASLRLVGDQASSDHMTAAATRIRAAGGIATSRVYTRFWLALFGCYPWERLPELPPELMFLPGRFPLSIYRFASWTRATLVPLAVVSAYRPTRYLGLDLSELDPSGDEKNLLLRFPRAPRGRLLSVAGVALRLDAALRLYRKSPLGVVRKAGLRRAASWIVERQEADGSWCGYHPPVAYSIIALYVLGYPLEHPVLQAGLKSLDGFSRLTEQGQRRLDVAPSPVWDTALAITALRDAGTAPDDPKLLHAADYLLGKESRRRGDWAVTRPHVPAGGWAFEADNQLTPDLDDTAEVAMALQSVDHPAPERVERALQRAQTWALGLQSRSGGWAAFDADNTSRLIGALPFCDFGEVTDPPSADVTAHVIEWLAGRGLAGTAQLRTACSWILHQQQPDGSWFGRWGANHIYGTGSALPALLAAGLLPSHPALCRALDWLVRHQNRDGGWGEDLRSYNDYRFIGRGESTPSQTAWALIGLIAAHHEPAVIDRGIAWLIDRQQPDGSWVEPQYTAVAFPHDYYMRYDLYRIVFPLTALGRYLSSETGEEY